MRYFYTCSSGAYHSKEKWGIVSDHPLKLEDISIAGNRVYRQLEITTSERSQRVYDSWQFFNNTGIFLEQVMVLVK